MRFSIFTASKKSPMYKWRLKKSACENLFNVAFEPLYQDIKQRILILQNSDKEQIRATLYFNTVLFTINLCLDIKVWNRCSDRLLCLSCFYLWPNIFNWKNLNLAFAHNNTQIYCNHTSWTQKSEKTKHQKNQMSTTWCQSWIRRLVLSEVYAYDL